MIDVGSMYERKVNKIRKGREAEKLAADFLVSKGYAVREMNWRPHTSHYEVDIIAQKGNEIIFVEVKARSNPDPQVAIEAVDLRKQRFIARAADTYLRMQPYLFYYRFDIIVVTGEGDGVRLYHIEDAFMPPLSSLGR